MHAHAATLSHAAGSQGAASPGSASAEAARLLASVPAGADFLSLLKRADQAEAPRPDPRQRDERDERQESEAPPEREPAEAEGAQAAHLQVPGAERAPQLRLGQTVAELTKTNAPAAVPTPQPAPAHRAGESAESRSLQGLTAKVESAPLDSRPRAALSAGTSSVALAAQANPQAQSQVQQAGLAQAGAGAGSGAEAQAEAGTHGSKLADPRSETPRAAATVREAATSAAPANTTLAGLEQMAQKTQAQATQAQAHAQAQLAQAHGQLQSAQAATSQVPGQSGLAQAAQLPSQATEPAQTAQRLAAQASAAAKPGAFAQAIPGLDGLSGSAAPAPAAKTEVAQAAKPVAATARSAQPAADQVAVQIQKGAAQGKDRIQIKLNPAELGRVDVKLEFQTDGGVRAVVAVERAETFDLLQRDARSLERALADAGFRGQTSLSFEMQNGGGQFAGGERDGGGGDAAARASQAPSTTEPTPAEAAHLAAEPAASPAGGVDIRI